MKRRLLVLLVVLFCPVLLFAQQADAETLFYKLRSKLDGIKDYVAEVRVKIDVSYMKVPPVKGKLYFKAPDKVKLERNGGVSILPKKSMKMNAGNMMPVGKVTIIDAGTEQVAGKTLRIIKVVPDNDNSDIVLTKIWIDEAQLLAVRTETTTRDNGTVKMELEFGKYAAQALPDKVSFYIDVKDYKLPKGLTMDYDDGMDEVVQQQAKGKSRKGKIQIQYLSYKLNQGLSDEIFVEKAK